MVGPKNNHHLTIFQFARAHERTSSKIEIVVNKNSSVSGDRSKNQDGKLPESTMRLVQADDTSFMYQLDYQVIDESQTEKNISEIIQKIAINKTMPMSLKEMVCH